MNEALAIAATSLTLIEDSGFQNELAEVRAHAVMENLGVDSSHITWTYHRRGLERSGTAGVFSIETAARIAPTVLEDTSDLPTAALRMAQLWEALAATSQNNATAPPDCGGQLRTGRISSKFSDHCGTLDDAQLRLGDGTTRD